MKAAALVAIALTALVVLSPMIVGGSSPSLVGIIALAAVILGSGLVLRVRGTGATRTLGSVLAISGVVLLALLVALLWLLVQGLGRPY